LSWTLPFFVVTGSFYVKFMRYLLPLTPFLMLYGAAMIVRAGSGHRTIRAVVATVVLGVTTLYALAYVGIYHSEHPWTAASRWVYENVPEGALLASEQWDDSLPMTMMVGDQWRTRGEYEGVELTWLTDPDAADNEEKLRANLETLADADYLTILSNRVYGVVPRMPQRFPLSAQYHQLLFDGDLGYELVFAQGRFPNFLGLSLQPSSFSWPRLAPPPELQEHLGSTHGIAGGRFDESFTVYDQPLVMIFQNVDHLTAEDMVSRFKPAP
jgi:hypothetical protein